MQRTVLLTSAFGVVLLAAACGDTPTTFTGPTGVSAAPPLVVRELRLSGQVVDVDRFEPVHGAAVTVSWLRGVPLAEPLTTMTGPDGAFEITVTEIEGVSVTVEIARDGYETRSYSFGPKGTTSATIRVYPTLVVRPGESLDTGIAPGLASMNSYCQLSDFSAVFDGDRVPCRRLLVDAPAGEAVEIELLPHGGLNGVGIIDSVPVPVAAALQRRVSVTTGHVWIVGAAGSVTVRASSR